MFLLSARHRGGDEVAHFAQQRITRGGAFLQRLFHVAAQALPVIVVTAKDLTAQDRQRLSGYVEKTLQKGASTRDALLREVSDLVGASMARRRGRS